MSISCPCCGEGYPDGRADEIEAALAALVDRTIAPWQQRLDLMQADHDRLMAERTTRVHQVEAALVEITAEAAAVAGRLVLADPQDTRLRDAVRAARAVIGRESREVPGAPEWCPICHTYHVDPGGKTDAGRVTRPCPRSPADAVWNQVERS